MNKEDCYALREVSALKREDLGALVNLFGQYEPLLGVVKTMKGYRLSTASNSMDFDADGKIMLCRES